MLSMRVTGGLKPGRLNKKLNKRTTVYSHSDKQ